MADCVYILAHGTNSVCVVNQGKESLLTLGNLFLTAGLLDGWHLLEILGEKGLQVITSAERKIAQVDRLQVVKSAQSDVLHLFEDSSVLERHKSDVTDPLESLEQVVIGQEVSTNHCFN